MAKGQFFGDTGHTVSINGITLTDTVYTHAKVDWHYHEQAYFTFILEGAVIEGNKRETYECPAGTLLFHHWQEPHYNSKPPGFTRGFHIEIEQSWLDATGIAQLPDGGSCVGDPAIRSAVRRLFIEMKTGTGAAGIESLLAITCSGLLATGQREKKGVPQWVYKTRELLHDTDTTSFSLVQIAAIAGVHPVHLSRGFARYFGSTLGSYQRMLKVEQSAALIPDLSRSLTEIGYECGFADQSHFSRSFRQCHGFTPKEYREMLLR